jgi:AAA domain
MTGSNGHPFADDYGFAEASEEDLAAAAAAEPKGRGNGSVAEPGVATIDWPSKEGHAPPDREFVVQDWLPTGCATSLYAPGGFGKSMLAQILASCVASARPFLRQSRH